MSEPLRLAACLPALLGPAVLLLPGAAGGQGSPALTVRPIPGVAVEWPASPPGPAPAAAQPAPAARTMVLTLRQLGAVGPLSLRGTTPERGVSFGVRADEVVTAATLSLSGAISAALLPGLSSVSVALNGEYLGTIPANRGSRPGFARDLPVPPALFGSENRLAFHLAGRSEPDCDDVLSPLLWATIADRSTLTLRLVRLPPRRDLSRLPLPFFDAHQPDALTLPFVIPGNAPDDLLRAAGIAAAWFGEVAGARGAEFPVRPDLPEHGDAVVILGGADAMPIPDLPVLSGPALALLPNPHDPLGTLLVVAGRSGAEAAAAAQALAMGIRALNGGVANVQAPDMAARTPYDAPAWLSAAGPVRLGDLVPAGALQSMGYAGLLNVPFRILPDLYAWAGSPLVLDLRWRAPPGSVVDRQASRLDIGLNGAYLASLPLAEPEWPVPWTERLLGLPPQPGARAVVTLPAADLAGNNELQFWFDARPLRRARCAAAPGDLRMAIDPDSTLDLSRGYHFAELPSLGAFATAGFPFTRMADLSQTAVVLPDRPAPEEVAAFLGLMGRFAAATGLPGVRVAVTRPEEAGAYAGRDLLLIGTVLRMQAADPLLAFSGLRLSGDRLELTLGPPVPWWRHPLGGAAPPDRAAVTAALTAPAAPGMSAIVGAESPLQPGRSVVAILAGGEPGLQAAMRDLREPARARLMHGDLVLLSGDTLTAYRVGPTYTVGDLPLWLWPVWYLRGQPWAALGVVVGAGLILVFGLAWLLTPRAGRERRG